MHKSIRQHFPHFFQALDTRGDLSLQEYSAALWEGIPPSRIEPELLDAFGLLCREQQRNPDETGYLLEQLRDYPLLQTSHHLTPTNGPVFTSIDLQCMLAKPNTIAYIVAGNSGVPLSNSAWSGALSFASSTPEQVLIPSSPTYSRFIAAQRDRERDGTSEQRISLASARWRDGGLYALKMEQINTAVEQDFSPRLRELLPSFQEYTHYATWCATACERLQRVVLGRDDIFYCDINRWIQHYLCAVLRKAEHPVRELLFSQALKGQLAKHLEDSMSFVLVRHTSKKGEKLRTLNYWQFCEEYTEKDFLQALTNNHCTVGTFLLFFILSALNGLTCYGSFLQYDYIPRFYPLWEAIGQRIGISVYTNSGRNRLTTGLPNDSHVLYPLDYYLQDRRIDTADYAALPMRVLWGNTLPRLERMIAKRL